MQMPEHTYVDTPEQLSVVGRLLEQAPWVALDTEGNSMFVYREQVCLMQLNIAGQLFAIDTLRIAELGGNLDAIKAPLENPAQRCWLHGGEYDACTLKRDYGIHLNNIWDSQQAASFLGWEKTGYGSVVERICDVKLDKAFTQYNWGTRPLDPGALLYGLDDVIHLPKVCDHLLDAVRVADLEEEVSIANLAVAATTWSGGFEPAGFWKIKGVREIPPHRLSLLCALYIWRNGLAMAANQPPGRMLNNEVLLALTRQVPTNFQLLKRMGLKGWFIAAHGEALLDAIKLALSNPPEVPERPRQREVLPEEEQRETRLKDWRRSEAENRSRSEDRPVPLQVVLPAKSLEYLKQHGGENLTAVPQLGNKRMQRYGDKLRDLCRV
jgi:ribonuclease D